MGKCKILAANWKMNKDIFQTKEYINIINEHVEKFKNCKVIIFPTFLVVNDVLSNINKLCSVGVQNIYYEDEGAFTGEISAPMVASLGAEYVIIGHSERKKYFNETNEIINKKIISALNSNLKVILCVGETFDERIHGEAFNVVSNQIKVSFNKIDKKFLNNIIIAYEPVWAIGTGKVINLDDAQSMGLFIKKTVKEYFSSDELDIKVLYGGSLNQTNIGDFLSLSSIDGGLIGGASLDAEKFLKMIELTSNL